MTTTIPFHTNATATAARIARILEPEGWRVTGTWNNRHEEAVHVTRAGRPMGSGVYIADGQQLVIGDDGRISVEEIGHA